MQSSLLAYLSKEASTKFQSSTSLRDGRTGNTWGNESQDDDQEIHNTKKMNNSAKGKLNSSRNIKRLPPGKPAERKKITLEDLELEKIDNDPILLSSKQYEVIEAILNHQSVFFTGAAGTGKSFILHLLRDLSVQLGISAKVVFTAPTGLAACNIGGVTIHSWSGIGLGRSTTKEIVDQIMGRHEVRNRWMNTDILVIDEISMLSAELFDTLSEIGKRVRNNFSQPFGGIQLVVCGDFYQLPPVQLGPKNRFCFMSNAWQELFPENSTLQSGKIIILDRVYRQRENKFLDILHEIRSGEVSASTRRFLNEKVSHDLRRKRELEISETRVSENLSGFSSDDINSLEEDLGVRSYDRPTKLFGYNNDVDHVNRSELARLSTEPYLFRSTDYAFTKTFETQLKNGSRLPEELELKTGAEVLLLWNLDPSVGLVNGVRGKVVGFERSRGRSKIFRDVLPVVEFRLRVGDREISDTRVILEQESEIKQGNIIVASRTQLPLVLGYAMSIHKAQGMTIPKLEVSFKGVFEYGQGYVAISRATDLDGLYLTSFKPELIKAHPDVKKYYADLIRLSSNSSVRDRETSIRELCRIAATAKVIPYENKSDESDGWIVKKGAHSSDSDEEKISPSSLVDHTPDPFSAFAYDDFLEYELPKKQQQKRSSNSKQRESTEMESQVSKKQKVDNKLLKSEHDVENDSNPVSSSHSSPAANWSLHEESNSRYHPTSGPLHSHLRSIDPNKNWNMITRTTGPMNVTPPSISRSLVDKSSRSSPISPPISSTTLTLSEEQKKKMEESKQRAQARLMETRARERHQIVENYINQLT